MKDFRNLVVSKCSVMKLLLPVFLFFNFLTINAQPFKLQMSLNSGLAIPLADFRNTDLQKGSFTLPGFTGAIALKTRLFKNITGMLEGGFQLNPVDVGLLGYEKMQADPFIEDLYIRSEPFKTIHLLAGAGTGKQLADKLRIDGEIQAGVIFSSTPYQLYKATYYLLGEDYFEITRSRDISFAYGASIQLIYEITPCYHIGLNNQFLSSRGAYDFRTGVGIRTDKRNITLWNSSFSLIVNIL